MKKLFFGFLFLNFIFSLPGMEQEGPLPTKDIMSFSKLPADIKKYVLFLSTGSSRIDYTNCAMVCKEWCALLYLNQVINSIFSDLVLKEDSLTSAYGLAKRKLQDSTIITDLIIKYLQTKVLKRKDNISYNEFLSKKSGGRKEHENFYKKSLIEAYTKQIWFDLSVDYGLKKILLECFPHLLNATEPQRDSPLLSQAQVRYNSTLFEKLLFKPESSENKLQTLEFLLQHEALNTYLPQHNLEQFFQENPKISNVVSQLSTDFAVNPYIPVIYHGDLPSLGLFFRNTRLHLEQQQLKKLSKFAKKIHSKKHPINPMLATQKEKLKKVQ